MARPVTVDPKARLPQGAKAAASAFLAAIDLVPHDKRKEVSRAALGLIRAKQASATPARRGKVAAKPATRAPRATAPKRTTKAVAAPKRARARKANGTVHASDTALPM